MSHDRNIIDTDSHFIIDPITRTITTESDKLVVTQYDHNSERFMFEIPLMVEGHDMSLCDRVEVHFTNITRNKKEENSDVYIITDLEKVDDFCCFSWLISRSATQLVGTLKFSVTFKCLDENGNVTYEWGTSVYDDIKIIAKLENTENVVDAHPDLYEQLKKDIPTKLSAFENDLDTITSDVMLTIMDEAQFAQPIADDDNSVLVTDDDEILIL